MNDTINLAPPKPEPEIPLPRPAFGPERRQGMQQWDKLKLHGALMADALLHPDQYNQEERDALVAHFHAIASRL